MAKKSSKSSSSSMREKAKKKAEQSMNRGKSSYLNVPEGVERLKPKKAMNMDVVPYIVTSDKHPIAEKGDQWYQRTFYLHYLDNKPYVCPKSVKKPCPVCEHVKELFNSEDAADIELAKQMRAKERELYNVIDLDDQDKGVQLFELSYHLFGKALDEEISEGDDELGGFAELVGGKTLRVSFRSKKLGKNEFLEVRKIEFEDRDDYEEDILDDVVDLDKALIIEDYDTLQKAIYGLEEEEEDEKPEKKSKKDADEDEDEDEPKKSVKKKKPSKKDEDDEDEEEKKPPKKGKKVKKEEPEEDEDEDEEEKKPSKKVKKEDKKADKKSKKNRCPHGHKFGEDNDEYDECSECDLWSSCADTDDDDD